MACGLGFVERDTAQGGTNCSLVLESSVLPPFKVDLRAEWEQ